MISAEWAAQLGHDAQHAGYTAGAVVDVILTRAGSIILALAEDIDSIDLDARRLPAGPARAALTEAAWLMSNTPTDRPFSQEDVDADNEWYERADLWSERFDALVARTPAAPEGAP